MKNFCCKKCKKVKDNVNINGDENEEELIERTINISRPVYTEPNFNKVYEQHQYKRFEPIKEIKKELNKHFSHGKNSVKKMIYNRLPIVKWIKDYRIKEYLFADFLAGLIIGIMQIPQGLLLVLFRKLNIFFQCKDFKFKDWPTVCLLHFRL